MAKPQHSRSRAPRLESWRDITRRQEPTAQSDTPPSSLLRRLRKWLVAAVAAPLAAFVGLYATGLPNAVLPCISDLTCQVRELPRSPEPGPKLRILLATLEHDTDGGQTRRVHKACDGDFRADRSIHKRRLPAFRQTERVLR
jgi:hypothetical protein